MPPKPNAVRESVGTGPASAAVDAYLAALDHPLKAEIVALRAIILSADAAIGEGIKWNAPSFHTTEHFATFHLRGKAGVQVVLHLGAKARADAGVRAGIVDGAELLQWRGPDRAIVTFWDMADVEARRDAFVRVLQQWITYV
ncbi:MAG TPA: DUF1801 domain-containing protein [Longimicrobiaceae bacterium]|nr:DUF1801 domain-containing protein [Longimicrobiaceae bacterium]